MTRNRGLSAGTLVMCVLAGLSGASCGSDETSAAATAEDSAGVADAGADGLDTDGHATVDSAATADTDADANADTGADANADTDSDTVGASNDLGVTFNAADFATESHPGNDDIIRDMTTKVGNITNGSWVGYSAVDFGAGAGRIEVSAATGSAGGIIEAWLDAPGSPAGTLVSTIDVGNTGGWSTFSRFSSAIAAAGVHDLYLVFTGPSGDLFDIESFSVTADDGFDERAALALDLKSANSIDWSSENGRKTANLTASAKFATGNDSGGRSIITTSLTYPLKDYKDPEFSLWSIMDCYFRWKDVPGKYTSTLKADIKTYIAGAGMSNVASTPNHYWMMAAGLLLAHQEWPGEVTYTWKSKSGIEDWIETKLDEIVHQGVPEFNSDTYVGLTFYSIQTIADFADNKVLANKARMTLDWLLMQTASQYLDGHYAAGAQRTYYPMQKANDGIAFGWSFFGRAQDASTVNSPAIIPALSSYRMPGIIRDMAWNRTEAFETRQTHYVRNTPVVRRLSSWITPEYALYSMYEVNNFFGLSNNAYYELQRWGVKWKAPRDENSTFFFKHPVPKRPTGNLSYQLGGSWFEQTLQEKNSLIAVYNVPANRPSEIAVDYWRDYLYGQLPTPATAKIGDASGKMLFRHYETVLIGMYSTKNIRRVQKTGYEELWVDPDSNGVVMGMAVETASPNDVAGATPAEKLANFAQQCRDRFNSASFTTPSSRPTLDYTNRAGDRLELSWRPHETMPVRKINNTPIEDINNDAYWPLLENPWLFQDVNGDTLRIENKSNTQALIYDFNNWTITSE